MSVIVRASLSGVCFSTLSYTLCGARCGLVSTSVSDTGTATYELSARVVGAVAGFFFLSVFSFMEMSTEAMKTAQPGTPAFRKALRDALEATSNVPATHGVFTMSKTDHAGLDQRGRVMVMIDNGKWVLQK